MKRTRATLTFLVVFTGDPPSLSPIGTAFMPRPDSVDVAVDVGAGFAGHDDRRDRARDVLGVWARQGAFR